MHRTKRDDAPETTAPSEEEGLKDWPHEVDWVGRWFVVPLHAAAMTILIIAGCAWMQRRQLWMDIQALTACPFPFMVRHQDLLHPPGTPLSDPAGTINVRFNKLQFDWIAS